MIRPKKNPFLVQIKKKRAANFQNRKSWIISNSLKQNKKKKFIIKQHINGFHRCLKNFLEYFKGFSSKHLNNYLTWNNVIKEDGPQNTVQFIRDNTWSQGLQKYRIYIIPRCIFKSEYISMNTLDDDIKPFRLKLPHYERNHTWLSLLLDCYSIIDFSVEYCISKSEKKVSCHKGCSICCHQTIPLSTLESMGIKFYVQEILSEADRLLIVNNFNKDKSICLFNIDNCCIVYKMRPISCRRYIITSKCCHFDEDPTTTRPNDILEPSREYLYRAISLTLPFYKSQSIYLRDNENIFDFYKRQNIILSSIYKNILNL